MPIRGAVERVGGETGRGFAIALQVPVEPRQRVVERDTFAVAARGKVGWRGLVAELVMVTGAGGDRHRVDVGGCKLIERAEVPRRRRWSRHRGTRRGKGIVRVEEKCGRTRRSRQIGRASWRERG